MSATHKQPKARLGRGLNSLISLSELPVEAEVSPASTDNGGAAPVQNEAKANTIAADEGASSSAPSEIRIDQITPNPHQPRRQMNEASIAELAASVKSTGLIQPIIVRKAGEGYQLIAGERRWRAARLAGLSAIPAIVRDVDSFTQAQMALVENIQREDLNPLDRAESYRALLSQLGLTQAELATRLGEDRSSIANFLRLLDLAEPVRQMIREQKLSMGHAKLLAGVPDILEQERLANLCISQELSVRNLERLLQAPDAPAPSARTGREGAAHLQDLEQSITRQLGMKVQVKSSGKKGRGRITIHYTSLDQFDQLIEKLGVIVE